MTRFASTTARCAFTRRISQAFGACNPNPETLKLRHGRGRRIPFRLASH